MHSEHRRFSLGFVLAATNIIIMQSHWEDKPTIPRGAVVKLMCWTECNSWKKTRMVGGTHGCQELKPVQDLSVQCGWTRFKSNVQSLESKLHRIFKTFGLCIYLFNILFLSVCHTRRLHRRNIYFFYPVPDLWLVDIFRSLTQRTWTTVSSIDRLFKCLKRPSWRAVVVVWIMSSHRGKGRSSAMLQHRKLSQGLDDSQRTKCSTSKGTDRHFIRLFTFLINNTKYKATDSSQLA